MNQKPVALARAARDRTRDGTPEDGRAQSTTQPFAARLVELGADGGLVVENDDGLRLECRWLQVTALPVTLQPGDSVLVLPLAGGGPAVVVGRIARYDECAQLPEMLEVAARQGLALRCGEASVDLRADGKVMIRGDDVLVRAKGTQRIRAGTVAIN